MGESFSYVDKVVDGLSSLVYRMRVCVIDTCDFVGARMDALQLLILNV